MVMKTQSIMIMLDGKNTRKIGRLYSLFYLPGVGFSLAPEKNTKCSHLNELISYQKGFS